MRGVSHFHHGQLDDEMGQASMLSDQATSKWATAAPRDHISWLGGLNTLRNCRGGVLSAVPFKNRKAFDVNMGAIIPQFTQ